MKQNKRTAKKKNSSTPKKNVSNTISVSESKLITDAQSVLGTRYKYGGETSTGWIVRDSQSMCIKNRE